MRILHTSDWHLGRRIHGFDLTAAHSAFIDWLSALVRERNISAVLISGDVYDRAIPHPDALALWDRALTALLAAGSRVIATSGNHDSFIRLGVGRRQLDSAGVHLRTSLGDIGRSVRLDSEGRLLSADSSERGVSIHGIPYLEPALVRERLGARARTHTAVLQAAVGRITASLPAAATADRQIVLAHAFVAGSVSSESERDVSVGGVGVAPLSLFESFDYAALGHVHRPQDLTSHVRYSGSPLPFSFGEQTQRKRVLEIETDGPEEQLTAAEHAVPEFMRLRTLSGSLAQVLAQAHEHAEALVSVELTDPERSPGALAQLRRALPGFVRMAWVGLRDDPASSERTVTSRTVRTDAQVFEEFYTAQRGSPPPAHARARFDAALQAAHSQAEGARS